MLSGERVEGGGHIIDVALRVIIEVDESHRAFCLVAVVVGGDVNTLDQLIIDAHPVPVGVVLFGAVRRFHIVSLQLPAVDVAIELRLTVLALHLIEQLHFLIEGELRLGV